MRVDVPGSTESHPDRRLEPEGLSGLEHSFVEDRAGLVAAADEQPARAAAGREHERGMGDGPGRGNEERGRAAASLLRSRTCEAGTSRAWFDLPALQATIPANSRDGQRGDGCPARGAPPPERRSRDLELGKLLVGRGKALVELRHEQIGLEPERARI